MIKSFFKYSWPALICLLYSALVLINYALSPQPHGLFNLVYILIIPGLIWISFLKNITWFFQLSLAPVLSLVVGLIVSELGVMSRWYSLDVSFLFIVLLSCFAALIKLLLIRSSLKTHPILRS